MFAIKTDMHSIEVSRSFGLRQRRLVIALMLLLFGASGGIAAEFDFRDPKGVNTIAFALDSRLEPLRGLASGISGTLHFDPADPGATRGRIVVAASSLFFPNQRMTEVLKSPDWLNIAEYPIISFTFRDVLETETVEDNTVQLEVRGDFELRGVVREKVLPVQITYLPGELAERVGDETPGDLIVLRTDFAISRLDYNIRTDLDFGQVARDIRIDVAIAGGAPHGVQEP